MAAEKRFFCLYSMALGHTRMTVLGQVEARSNHDCKTVNMCWDFERLISNLNCCVLVNFLAITLDSMKALLFENTPAFLALQSPPLFLSCTRTDFQSKYNCGVHLRTRLVSTKCCNEYSCDKERILVPNYTSIPNIQHLGIRQY